MQPSTYYKLSRLPETEHEALRWLAGRLRWERTLSQLRTRLDRTGARRPADRQAA